MSSVASPTSWPQTSSSTYNRDCSQKVCSNYCLQWCINILPPPSAEYAEDGSNTDDDSHPNFSPLIIAIITILASALFFVTFYTIFTNYFRRRRRRTRFDVEANRGEATPRDHQVSSSTGDAVVKNIKVFKYKKGEGAVEGLECSVCLAEFQEDESLRLLPKCSHAFHVNCIDTWLRSQPNCPICRANISSNVPTLNSTNQSNPNP